MILRDLQREVEAENLRTRAVFGMLQIPLVSAETREQIFKTAHFDLYRAQLLALLTPSKAEAMKACEVDLNPNVNELAEQFVLLKEGGLADILSSALSAKPLDKPM